VVFSDLSGSFYETQSPKVPIRTNRGESVMPTDKKSDGVPGLYRIIPLTIFRRTPGVFFDKVPLDALPRIDAVDRVIHEQAARSPGPVGDVIAPWYMHPHQDDNLIILHGTRYVELYTRGHGKVESFVVTPRHIKKEGVTVFDGAAMLVWPRGVFHRIVSSEKAGSSSLNFAAHYEGFDIRTNFNVFDLDLASGKFRVIREGHMDQPERN